MSSIVERQPPKSRKINMEDEIFAFQYNEILHNVQELYWENNENYKSTIKCLTYLHSKGILENENVYKKLMKDFTTIYVSDEIAKNISLSFNKLMK